MKRLKCRDIKGEDNENTSQFFILEHEIKYGEKEGWIWKRGKKGGRERTRKKESKDQKPRTTETRRVKSKMRVGQEKEKKKKTVTE